MKIRYLLDENIEPDVLAAVQRWDANIDILRVGQVGAPRVGTLDPEILLYCESQQRALVTENRVSMAIHIATHFQAGHQHWGIFEVVPNTITIGYLAEMLYLHWATEEAENIKNGITYIK